MDLESPVTFRPILSSSLCPHRAPARRLPARVVRRRPGRAAAGRAGSFHSGKNGHNNGQSIAAMTRACPLTRVADSSARNSSAGPTSLSASHSGP